MDDAFDIGIDMVEGITVFAGSLNGLMNFHDCFHHSRCSVRPECSSRITAVNTANISKDTAAGHEHNATQ